MQLEKLSHTVHRKIFRNIYCEKMNAKLTNDAQHKSNLRNVYGTFAIEGMTISKSTRSNLDRIGSGQVSYQQIVNELRAKYDHPDNA